MKQSGKNWLIAGLLLLCYTLSYMDRVVISILVEPIKASLGVSDTQIGLLHGVSFSLFYVLASLPLAYYADNGHRPRMIAICVVVWSVMTMLCGFAYGFMFLLLARIGMAMAEAGLPPASLTMLGDMFDAKRLARATSLFMLAPFLGGGIALLFGGLFYEMTATWSLPVIPGVGQMERWQAIFLMIGAPGLLVALFFVPISDPRPAVVRRKIHEGNTKAQANSIIPIELLRLMKREWRFSVLYILSIALMMTLMSAYISWIPAAIIRSKGIDEKTVGMLYGPIYLLCGVAGTLFSGYKISCVKDDIVGGTLSYMRICICIMFPVGVIGPLVSSLYGELLLMGVAIFLVSSIAALSSLPFQYVVPKHMRARAIAILALTSALLGTGLGPLLVGLISDLFTSDPLSLSYALSAIGFVIMPVVIIMLDYVMSFHRIERLDLRYAHSIKSAS